MPFVPGQVIPYLVALSIAALSTGDQCVHVNWTIQQAAICRGTAGCLDRPDDARHLREWQHTWKPPPVAQIAEAKVIRECGLDDTG